MVLTPKQFMMWQNDFKEQCVITSTENINKGHGVGYDQLAGENAFATPPAQVNYPQEVYVQIQAAALRAVRKIPESGQGASESFAKILQGPTESLFIDWLQATLEGQIEHDEARELLLRQLAYEDCKRTLQPIRNRNPPLADMVRACQNIGSASHRAAALASALTAQLKMSETGNQGISCYQCGAPGHLECVQKGSSKKAMPPHDCPRCGKGKHWANECHSKYHANGYAIPSISGNRSWGARPHVPNNQRNPHPGVWLVSCGQQLQEVPAWTWLSDAQSP